jgi:hypothetical protein
MTYSEKLKDPRWQRKRLEIMERDDFTCVICHNAESTLNVHHCYYGKGRSPWEYDSQHLITLCHECHSDVERVREEILKEMTWEIPIYAIHGLATRIDPFFLSQIASFLAGSETPSAIQARIRMGEKLIASFSETLKQMRDSILDSESTINQSE